MNSSYCTNFVVRPNSLGPFQRDHSVERRFCRPSNGERRALELSKQPGSLRKLVVEYDSLFVLNSLILDQARPGFRPLSLSLSLRQQLFNQTFLLNLNITLTDCYAQHRTTHGVHSMCHT